VNGLPGQFVLKSVTVEVDLKKDLKIVKMEIGEIRLAATLLQWKYKNAVTFQHVVSFYHLSSEIF